MPSNKTSLYDGQVFLYNSNSLDLSGKICLENGGTSVGDTVIGYDGGLASLAAGDDLYSCSATGTGALQYIGTIDSVTESGSAGSFSGNITLTEGCRIALADNAVIVRDLPRFEIVSIQIVIAGALSALWPVENRFPGTHLSDGATTWNDTETGSYYGAVDGTAGTAVAGDLEAGIVMEGRWKYVTMSSSDACVCNLKAVSYRSLEKDNYK